MSIKNKSLLPDRLAELRAEAGLSQAQLGRLVGVTATTIGFWESAKHDPTPAKLINLASQLRTTRAYLVGDSDNPTRPPNTPPDPFSNPEPDNELPQGLHDASSVTSPPTKGYFFIKTNGDKRVHEHAKQLMKEEFLDSPEELLNWLLRQDLKRRESGQMAINELYQKSEITKSPNGDLTKLIKAVGEAEDVSEDIINLILRFVDLMTRAQNELKEQSKTTEHVPTAGEDTVEDRTKPLKTAISNPSSN